MKRLTAEDRRFLKDYDPSEFFRPSVTVDTVLLKLEGDDLRVAVVRRPDPPFEGLWALPGGFVSKNEDLPAAAERVLMNKAGVRNVYLEQLQTFGDPRRDPRTRVISVAYFALIEETTKHTLRLGENAQFAKISILWEGETGGPVKLVNSTGSEIELAFDHAEIIGVAIKRLRGQLPYMPIAYELLPPTFTLLELQHVHEVILGRHLNKDSFRRTALASGELERTSRMQAGVDHRPAALYRVRSRRSGARKGGS